jgi:hypothetical protein
MAAPGFITRKISSSKKSHYYPNYWRRVGGPNVNEMDLR